MLGLPVTTHRYLIQPLADGIHVKQVFIKRFLKFCDSLINSSKAVVRETFRKIRLNVKTVTGNNLAEIAQQVGKPVMQLTPSDVSKVVYEAIDVSDVYRVDFIKEIIDVKHGILEVDGFNVEEMDLILQHLC